MKIPDIIKRTATRGFKVDYLGTIDNRQYFNSYMEGCKTGFPEVLVLNNGKVSKLEGFEALDCVQLFVKD